MLSTASSALRSWFQPSTGLVRTFHSSRPIRVTGRHVVGAPRGTDAVEGTDAVDYQEWHQDEGDGLYYKRPLDATSAGHRIWDSQRRLLHYLRLIEHELPKLVEFRKSFKPPTAATPVIVRSIDYAGEAHPATVKRSVVVPVARLPLKDAKAVHNVKLLAGPRWSPEAPSNSGFGANDFDGEHGYIHISCEDFPEPAMNLKWASDVLDRLVAQSNNFDEGHNIPIDNRHLVSKLRKQQGGRLRTRPSLKDFPKEWLPPRKERRTVDVTQ